VQPELDDLIHKVTEGKPFIFVAMPFGRNAEAEKIWIAFYDSVKATVKSAVGLSCIRADELRAGGYNMLDKIQRAIQVSTNVRVKNEVRTHDTADRAGCPHHRNGRNVRNFMDVLLSK
jgi:hypothetical protein